MELARVGHHGGMDKSMFERRRSASLALVVLFAAGGCMERAGTREAWSGGEAASSSTEAEAGSAPSTPSSRRDAAAPERTLDAGVFVVPPQDPATEQETVRADANVRHDAGVTVDAGLDPQDAGQEPPPFDEEEDDDD
jgi:hypothetical protein